MRATNPPPDRETLARRTAITLASVGGFALGAAASAVAAHVSAYALQMAAVASVVAGISMFFAGTARGTSSESG